MALWFPDPVAVPHAAGPRVGGIGSIVDGDFGVEGVGEAGYADFAARR